VCVALGSLMRCVVHDDKLSMVPRMRSWGLQRMEVLVRHGAQFEFPTRDSRDAVRGSKLASTLCIVLDADPCASCLAPDRFASRRMPLRRRPAQHGRSG
jgi:hypothetical protein